MYEIFEISNKEEIKTLGEIAGVDEQIDFNCEFIGTRKENELIGIAGINFKHNIPRFEHIIIHPKFQRTRLSLVLMKKAEEYILNKGYIQFVSYILNTREYMQKYAKKWGMLPYYSTDKGVWFYKILVKEKNYAYA